MAAKPAVVPVWAEDANYPAGPEPEAGTPTKSDPERTDIGWRPNEKPTAQGDNYRRNLVGEWLEYLDDGDFDGDHTIDGDLEITGDLDVDGEANVDGSITVAGGVKHGDRPHSFLLVPYYVETGTYAPSVASFATKHRLSVAGIAYCLVPQLKKGDRIKSITVVGAVVSGVSEPSIAVIDQVSSGAGPLASTGVGGIVAGGEVTYTFDDPIELLSNHEVFIVKLSGNGSAVDFYTAFITFDHPGAF